MFSGKLHGNKLVAGSDVDKSGYVHRATLNMLNDDRVLLLFEKRKQSQSFYSRVAQIGYTRQGVSLARAGVGRRECVVTGGKGTMKVSHMGKTYYVCCTGCKQAFDDDPEGILADYRKRLAERKAKRAGSDR